MNKQHIKATFGRPSKFQVSVVDQSDGTVATTRHLDEDESKTLERQVIELISSKGGCATVIRRRV